MRLFAHEISSGALHDLAARGLSDDVAATRPVLLRALTDFFVMRPSHTKDEIEQFAEIAHRLVSTAARDEIDHAAEALCHHANAPVELLDLLAARGGAGALMLLTECRRLSSPCLRNAAAMGPLDAALAVASRADLDGATIELLARRPEIEIVRALARNESAPLGPDLLPAVVARARDDAQLAQIIAARLPHRAEVLPLFLIAETRQRDIMIARARAREGTQETPDTPIDSKHSSLLWRIESLARDGLTGELPGALAQACGCNETMARTIVGDPGGEALALALRAIGLPADVATRVFLAADPQIERAPGKLSALTKLAASLPQSLARKILDCFAGTPAARTRPAPQHEAQVREALLRAGTAPDASPAPEPLLRQA